MRALLDRYAAFFRHRGALRFTLVGLLARMPLGTLGIATLLHVRDLTGSIAFAGAVMGVQQAASAASAPVLGRLVDTRGPRSVLLATGVVSPLAILVLLSARELALSRSAILAVAAVTGAFLPPATTLVRTLWRMRFADDEAAQHRAFAIDGVLLEVAYTVGPALIAAAIAVASPRVALALAFAFVAAAVPLLHLSGGLAWWRQSPPAERRLLGPLHDPRLVAVYLATFFLSMNFGATEVGYPGFATAQGATPWGPLLIAVGSVGSAIGGVVYGGLHLRTPVDRQLPVLMGLLALPLLAHTVLSSIGAMVPWALLAGVMIAPSMTAVMTVVSTAAPAKYATEAFTWSSTAIVTGIGAGMAVAGTLVERFGPNSPFAFAAGAVAAGALLAMRVRNA
jgi:MFS family permease